MATAADDGLAAPTGRATRPRGACDWADKCFEIIRSDAAASDSTSPSDRTSAAQLSTQLPGMRGPDDDEDVTDIVHWQRLEQHVRGELQLEGDGKLEVALQHNSLSVVIKATNPTSLSLLHRQLDAHADTMLEPITLRARLIQVSNVQPMAMEPATPTAAAIASPATTTHIGQRTVSSTPLLALPAAAQLTAEQLFKRLKTLCYGVDRAQHSVGSWSAACTQLMQLNPKHLLIFDELRHEGVGRALGSGDFVVNPISACCPKCGVVLRLTAANQLSKLVQHIQDSHGKECTLAKRLQLADSQRLVTAADLDSKGLLEDEPPLCTPPTDRADYFSRATTSHWLLPWLELLLARLTMQHVAIQMLLGLLYVTVGWSSIPWARHVPTLLSFAHQLYYIAKPKGLNLLRGRGFFGQGSISSTILCECSACNPGTAPWPSHEHVRLDRASGRR
jgi:hypothetical protein